MVQEIITVLIGASPVVEARGAIPVAMALFHFSPMKAYILAMIGNLLPVAPLFLLLHYAAEYLMGRFAPVSNVLSWVFQRTRRNHGPRFAVFSAFALFIFVAIPLPGTGVWTATIIAFLFGFPLKRSLLSITLGGLTAGGIVLLLTMGALSVF